MGALGQSEEGWIPTFRNLMDAEGLGSAAIAQALAAVRTLLRFVLRRGGPPFPMGEGVRPKKEETLPKVLTEREVERALAHESGDTDKSVRNRTLMELLYSSGLRVSEAVSLPWRGLYLDEGYVRVTGKGGKMRQVPIGRSALGWIKRWHDVVPEGVFVFPGGGASGHMDRATAFRVVKEALDGAGAEGEGVGPHAFRHAFATHLLAHGADLRVIQELLGHADLQTTQIYTHLLEKDVRQAWERFHPHATLEG
ncbi:tyrosine-type recombinase/integrase [bacterium]|nr:tyrosine-type recombinase/integrase [bacterium]